MSSLEERTGNVRAKRSAVLQSAERAVGRECITPQNKHIWYISRGTSRQKSSNRVHRGPARSGKPPPGARESFDLDFCCRWVDRLMPAPTWHQTRRRRNDSPPWFCPVFRQCGGELYYRWRPAWRRWRPCSLPPSTTRSPRPLVNSSLGIVAESTINGQSTLKENKSI